MRKVAIVVVIYGWRSPFRELQIEALLLTAKVRCVRDTSAGRGTRAASISTQGQALDTVYQYLSGTSVKRYREI